MWRSNVSHGAIVPSARCSKLASVPAETGADERVTQKREGVDMAMDRLPHARVHWIEGDHDIHAQHPVELADVMLDQVADGFFA